jgi:dolichyl-phosphate beta-glucosyltransferase
VMSKVFNVAVQALAVPGISDTQCGFKGFTAHAARKIFSVAQSDRFGFDVEALYLAKRHGFRIDELPVICHYHGGSSVRRLSDGVRMFADILAIRSRHG